MSGSRGSKPPISNILSDAEVLGGIAGDDESWPLLENQDQPPSLNKAQQFCSAFAEVYPSSYALALLESILLTLLDKKINDIFKYKILAIFIKLGVIKASNLIIKYVSEMANTPPEQWLSQYKEEADSLWDGLKEKVKRESLVTLPSFVGVAGAYGAATHILSHKKNSFAAFGMDMLLENGYILPGLTGALMRAMEAGIRGLIECQYPLPAQSHQGRGEIRWWQKLVGSLTVVVESLLAQQALIAYLKNIGPERFAKDYPLLVLASGPIFWLVPRDWIQPWVRVNPVRSIKASYAQVASMGCDESSPQQNFQPDEEISGKQTAFIAFSEIGKAALKSVTAVVTAIVITDVVEKVVGSKDPLSLTCQALTVLFSTTGTMLALKGVDKLTSVASTQCFFNLFSGNNQSENIEEAQALNLQTP